ncbi:uncharacterized protein LOC115886917 [Sitophilus oryzae]|uniref:Uncharacterized protein LOC115886917 n=1 Tax=Sitophilus oryzae TaxID=7048 RepID=A0A6J2YG57_SITOR|nr:uncharacterized protein LOC115886917 [Sitophilus oryzae]
MRVAIVLAVFLFVSLATIQTSEAFSLFGWFKTAKHDPSALSFEGSVEDGDLPPLPTITPFPPRPTGKPSPRPPPSPEPTPLD